MTGVLDMRTPMPQTEEYYSALKMRGVPAVLLRFENEWHGTSSRPSNWMRTQLYMMSWYNKWGGPRTLGSRRKRKLMLGTQSPAVGPQRVPKGRHRQGDRTKPATPTTSSFRECSTAGPSARTIPCGTIRDIRLEFDPAGFTIGRLARHSGPQCGRR